MGQFSKTVLTMKVFAAILLLATLAQSRPRHILVPYDDEIEQPQVRFIPLPQQYNYRVARSAFPQEAPPAFAIPDGIRAAEEQIAAGSGPSPPSLGEMLLIMEHILEDMVPSVGILTTLTMKELAIVVDKNFQHYFSRFNFSSLNSSYFNLILPKLSFLLSYRKINFIDIFLKSVLLILTTLTLKELAIIVDKKSQDYFSIFNFSLLNFSYFYLILPKRSFLLS